MPTIIEIDSFKEKIDGYKPENASDFHEKSAKMADQAFRLEVISNPHKT
jgi:hypothetical protein